MKKLIYKITGSYSGKSNGGLFLLLLMLSILKSGAQPELTFYSDAGRNSISDGLFIKSAFLGNYGDRNYFLKAGIETNLVNENNIALSGFRIDGSRLFKTKNAQIELNGFGLWNNFSDIISETNYGCLLSVETKHFELQFGTNFRTYCCGNTWMRFYEGENQSSKIHENFNLMYLFKYNLKPSNHRWNLGIAVTNIDYFMINQETNPYINIDGYFSVNKHIKIFSGAWYKTAGLLNMSSNYFGFLMRGGIIWNLN